MTPIRYAYIANRRKGIPAARALELARAKPSPYGGYTSFLPGGNITRQPTRPQYAWIEDTQAAGLRFVDYADNIAPRSIRHCGWYKDDDGAYDTFRGAVWRLPRGTKGLIAGYTDPWNKGAAFVELHRWDTDDAIGAACAADRIAELEAEKERDYRRAWRAGRRFEDLADDITAARRACLSLIRETKAARDSLTSYDSIKALIRARIESLRDDIRNARDERKKLFDEYGHAAGFTE